MLLGTFLSGGGRGQKCDCKGDGRPAKIKHISYPFYEDVLASVPFMIALRKCPKHGYVRYILPNCSEQNDFSTDVASP